MRIYKIFRFKCISVYVGKSKIIENFLLHSSLHCQHCSTFIMIQFSVSCRSSAENLWWLLADGLGTDGTYHCYDHQVIFLKYFFISPHLNWFYQKFLALCLHLQRMGRLMRMLLFLRVVERGRVKCGQYWPLEEGKAEKHGYFLIRNTHNQLFQDFQLTHLELYNTQVHLATLKKSNFNMFVYLSLLEDLPSVFSSLGRNAK